MTREHMASQWDITTTEDFVSRIIIKGRWKCRNDRRAETPADYFATFDFSDIMK